MSEIYVKKSTFNEKTVNQLTGNEYFDLHTDDGQNIRIKSSEIKKLILGVANGTLRPIGDDNAGSIVTTSDSQEISNKDLVDCKVNSGNILAVNSTELNHMAGVTENVRDKLGELSNEIDLLEGQVNGIGNSIGGMEAKFATNIRRYNKEITVDTGTALKVSASEITENRINYQSVSCKMYIVNGDGDYVELSTEGLVINTTSDNGVMLLDGVTFPETSHTKKHLYVIYYSVLA